MTIHIVAPWYISFQDIKVAQAQTLNTAGCYKMCCYGIKSVFAHRNLETDPPDATICCSSCSDQHIGKKRARVRSTIAGGRMPHSYLVEALKHKGAQAHTWLRSGETLNLIKKIHLAYVSYG